MRHGQAAAVLASASGAGISDKLFESAERRSVGFLLSCSMLLMLITFSPERAESGGLDAAALAKVAGRAMILGGLAIFLYRRWSLNRTKAVFKSMRIWWAYGAWAFFSLGWSALRSVTIFQSISFIILIMLAASFAISTRPTDLERVLRGLVLSLLTMCVILLCLRFGKPDLNCMSRDANGILHATNTSATAALGILLLTASRCLYGWKWTKRWLLPCLVIFSAVLLLSQSRTSIMTTLVVAGGLAAFRTPPLWRALLMVASGTIGTFYLAIDLQLNVTDRMLNALATYLARGQTPEQLAKLSGREEMWTVMWDSFWESPLIGHGYFVSSSTGELYVWYTWGNWTAHNFWLQALVTTGTIGALILGCAVAQLAFRLFRAVLRGDVEWQFGALIGSVMIWQLGWGMNNETFIGPLQPESVIYLTMVGLATSRFTTHSE